MKLRMLVCGGTLFTLSLLANADPTYSPASRSELLVAAATAQTLERITYNGSYFRIGYPMGDVPSQYGVSDCFLIADDSVEAITGERIDPSLLGYSNEVGAAKKMRQHGFENVEQIFASKFEEIPPSQAQRGDIGIVESDGELCGGVFTALGFATRDEFTLLFLPVSRVKTAFKVGR